MMNFQVGKNPIECWRDKRNLAKQKERNLEIDAALLADARKARKDVNILLLGLLKSSGYSAVLS